MKSRRPIFLDNITWPKVLVSVGTKIIYWKWVEEDVQSSTTEEEGSDGDHDDMKTAKCLKLRNTEEYFKIHHPGCFIQDFEDLWKSYFW